MRALLEGKACTHELGVHHVTPLGLTLGRSVSFVEAFAG
jgi:hypothetical protein